MDEAESPHVKHVGQEIQRRRKAIGIDVAPFAKEAGVSRTTVTKVEAGEVEPRDKSLHKIIDALDRLEHEGGRDIRAAEPTSGGLVTFRAQGVFGAADVTVAGPVENTAELAEQFARLLDNLRRRENGDDSQV